MKTPIVIAVITALLAAAFPARAQDTTTRFEAYAGYDYARFNVQANVGGFPPMPTFNLNGGGGQFEYNASHWLGLVGDLAGYAATNSANSGAQGEAFSYLFGPRVNFRRGKITPFAQVLFGGILTSSGIESSGVQNNFAMTAGGGIDIKITKLIAIRPVQAEYFLTKIPDGLNNRQNNFRFSAGIVFRFGRT